VRADRRKVLAAGALLGLSAWSPVAAARALEASQEALIRVLLARMTLAEKLGQMTQIAGGRQKALNSKLDAAMLDRVRRGEVGSFLHVAGAQALRELQRVAVEESRLGIPLLFAMDVIHGYRTILPVPLALAASWDVLATERAAAIASDEAWAAGLHWTFAPMVDVARDARWGRVVEGAGEDPYLGSRMAVAQVRGFQGTGSAVRTMACVKHFAGYGAAAGGRDYDSAELSDRTLNEVYLPPFWAAAQAGAGSFMTAFNDIAGVPMTANADLVRGVLREQWNYGGLVVSDWNAILELVHHGVAATPMEAAVLALKAGVDMDMASNSYAEQLAGAVAQDKSLVPLIDQAVARILGAKMRLGLFDTPYAFGDAAQEAAPLRRREQARGIASRAVVLARNESGLLPLTKGRKIALIGALADDASSTLGSWRARGQIADAVTLRQALEASKDFVVEYSPGAGPRSTDTAGIAAAVEAAKRADIVLLAIGEDYDMTAEARSRADLALPGTQQALVDALKATGKPIVAILMSGRPLALEASLAGIPAVMIGWFLGLESGNALLDALTGKAEGLGRLPISFPRATGQVPMTYAHLPTGRPANPDLAVDSARYHDVGIGPLFPFGHGLEYSDFTYSDLQITPAAIGPHDKVKIRLKVSSESPDWAFDVVQLYVRDPVASVERPVKELRGWQRCGVRKGQSEGIVFVLTPDQFAIWKAGKWVIEPGRIEVMIGRSSDDIRLTGSFEIKAAGLGTAPAAAIETVSDMASGDSGLW
jgi:beta-glucosidase